MSKGYAVNSGYMGWIPSEGRYMLFDTEGDYDDYMEDLERAQNMTLEELWAEVSKRNLIHAY